MRSPAIPAALALALAACSGGGGNAAANAPDPTVVNEMPDLSVNMDDVKGVVTPPSPTPVEAIPAMFQGRWGILDQDCNPANAAAAKGLMTIAGNRLTFYEARGDATRLRSLGPGRLGFDVPMSGEGTSWSEPTTLTLLGDGRTLIREAKGSPERRGSFIYHRCPA